jgi:hypothetical protein
VRHVSYLEEMKTSYKIPVEKTDERRPLGIPRVYGKEILKWVLEK